MYINQRRNNARAPERAPQAGYRHAAIGIGQRPCTLDQRRKAMCLSHRLLPSTLT